MKYIGIHSNYSYLHPSNYQVLGIYKGVEARRSLLNSPQFLFQEGFFTGNFFDDLEFIRRFNQKVRQVNFYNISTTKELWSLSKVERISDSVNLQVERIENSSSQVPRVDDILIWTSSNLTDLVWRAGIVSSVEESCLKVASQESLDWSGSYSQEFLISSDGPSLISVPGGQVAGWLRVTEKELQSPSGVKRVSFNARQLDGMFDLDDPFELAFSKDPFNFGEYREVMQYYEWTEDYYLKILTSASELHHMVIQATARVISSDEMMRKFEIHEAFWPFIRNAWASNQPFLSGRFDLASDGKTVKLLEYNADSAGIISESSIIQNLWARTTGCDVGSSGGALLHERLVSSWKQLSKGRKVHIFVDYSEDEEIYMEKYYARVLKDAGVDFKLNNRIPEIQVNDSGVFDKDGEAVQLIWKVWNWNTIFQKFFESGENRKLADIMLHPSVTVVEPIWKIVTSNKALLPVLWEMFPNHPLLLRTEFQLSTELAADRYVSKPISGRLGENVTVFQAGQMVEGKEGKFSESASVYQQFFDLPQFDDGFHAILGCWVIGEAGSGIIVREHQSLITGYYSPIICCRVVASQ